MEEHTPNTKSTENNRDLNEINNDLACEGCKNHSNHFIWIENGKNVGNSIENVE